MKTSGLHIGLVGPLPPPSGGMANQTQQLAKLLRDEGVLVELIQVNRSSLDVFDSLRLNKLSPEWKSRQ